MRSDYLPGDLKRLWLELASNPIPVRPDALRLEARRLRRGVRLRNGFVFIVCSLIIAAYSMFLLKSSTSVERIGCALSIAGAANVIIQFSRRPARAMPESGELESIRFYRSELQRHRDFHGIKGIGSWLLPLLPGPILFNVAFALEYPALAVLVAVQLAVFVAIAAIIVPLNARMAKRFQRRIDALDTTARQ